MTTSTLFELLKILSGSMIKDLKVFMKMSSNHLSKDEEIIMNSLLLEFQKATNTISEDKFKSKYLKREDLKNWNRMKNRFLEVLRKYLILEVLSSKVEANLTLASFYSQKKLPKNFKSTINKVSKHLNKNVKIDENTNYYKFLLHEIEETNHLDIRKRLDDLIKMDNTLDDFYIENKFRVACEYLNRKTVINESFSSLERFISFFESKNIEQLGIGAQIYFYTFKLLQTEDQIYFETIFQLIKEHQDRFTQPYLKSIFSYLLNHCSKMVNKGKLNFSNLYIKIIDLQISHNLLLDDKIISSNRFKNCITISIIAQRIDWAINFIENFKIYLPDTQKQVYNFSLAQVLLFQEKYEECHEQLIGFEVSEMYNKIAYEKLLLKLYYYQYKRKGFKKENIKTKINSLKKYIKLQSKLHGDRKTRVLMFLECISKLVNNEGLTIDPLLGKIPPIDYVWLRKEVTPSF